MKRYNDRTPTLVVFRILVLQTLGNRVHLGLCLCDIDAGPEPGNHHVIVVSADDLLLVGPCQGRPHLREVGLPKIRRHHPGDKVALAIQANVVSHDVAIATEMFLPETMAEHNNIGVAGLILVLREHPSEHGLHTKG